MSDFSVFYIYLSFYLRDAHASPIISVCGSENTGELSGFAPSTTWARDGSQVRLSARALTAEPSHRSVHLMFNAFSTYLTEL